jgi:hypothetical protein
MRELTDFERWVVNELEKLEKQNLILHKKDKETALRIRDLEVSRRVDASIIKY